MSASHFKNENEHEHEHEYRLSRWTAARGNQDRDKTVHFVRCGTSSFEADGPELWPAVAQKNPAYEVRGAGRYVAVEELQPDGTEWTGELCE